MKGGRTARRNTERQDAKVTDPKNPKLIYLKGFLFLIILGLSVLLILLETRSWRIAGLLALVIWAAARFYYFRTYGVRL